MRPARRSIWRRPHRQCCHADSRRQGGGEGLVWTDLPGIVWVVILAAEDSNGVREIAVYDETRIGQEEDATKNEQKEYENPDKGSGITDTVT